ncbi:MAG TPA: hypothetical protein VFL16_09150 [Steroidobacteraceae bacterium]|nr:hypothetical protein [Steroidobacteraceae bacterium]
MSVRNHIPRTVAGNLDARLAPFRLDEPHSVLEDLDVEPARAVSPRAERRAKLSLVNDLKLLFAALAAGGSTVPLGDNSRAARLLADYARSLRDH